MMRANRERAAARAAWLLITLLCGGMRASADDDQVKQPAPATAFPSAKSAIEPAAPILAAEVVAAMQEARYDDARRTLLGLAEKAVSVQDRAYFRYVGAVADRLAGKPDMAREALLAALRVDPGGRWAARIQFELAQVELAAGDLATAEAHVRALAERLLSPDRKDRLAEVYLAYAAKKLEPGDPVIAADPEAAYALLGQAFDLARGPALRARILETKGRASLAASNPVRALEDFRAYLREFPTGADRLTVRLKLAEAQQRANDRVAARLTLSDLARDIERLGAAERTPALTEIRATALYRIAATYGMPAPVSDLELSLGVAALHRFLTAAPAHAEAVRAAYSIGAAYQARSKGTEAYDAFSRFLKEEGFRIESDPARRDWAELSMTASFQIGEVLRGQERYSEAIAAWKGYLARFPNGPQGADAQRAILATQLLIADDQFSRGHFEEARAAWSDFAARNPLDDRVPGLLFRVGESFESERRYDRAIASWETLAAKFPAAEPAGHARYQIALLLETIQGKLAEAVERYRAIDIEPWRERARERIALLESRQLTALTPRTFRSGDPAYLRVQTRNLETLHFAAYKLNAESYFRSRLALDGVESLDVGLVAPDAAWTVPVPGYERYKPVDTKYDLKGLELPGVYAVKVTDDRTLQATTLVVGSDLDAIVKSSAGQLMVFVQDMKTGRGRAGARVLVADGQRLVLEAKTGDDGVLLQDWSPARVPMQALNYLVLDGPHVAGSRLTLGGTIAQGLSPRAYIYTDRPAYRPGQDVSVRGVVREARDGSYANMPGAVYRFEVADSRGRLIVARPVTLSEYGTFHETVPLDAGAPLGTYRITVSQPGKSVFPGHFEVQAYHLEPIALLLELERTVVYRGEVVKGRAVARYSYGEPLASQPVEVQLPDGRTLHGQTDATGAFPFTLPTDGFAEEQTLALVARLPREAAVGAAQGQVRLAVRGFEIEPTTARQVYVDGESFTLQVITTDPLGQPIGETLSAALVKKVKVEGRDSEREVSRRSVATDARTGRGSATFRAEDSQGGDFVLRVSGTDRFGTPIVAERAITISGKTDETKLRLLADRLRYKVGEEASVNLHSRGRAGTALLTWEADRVLSYRVVTLHDGDNPLGWAVDHGQFPNFTLTATRMWDSERDEARLDVQVERDLRVTIAPARPVVGPGEPVELEITTVDQLGRPVSAELSLAMVDRSLLDRFNDRLPDIGTFFYNQKRTGSFSTSSTNTFRYRPATIPVAQAVVDEAERGAAMAANAADRAGVLEQAQGQTLAMDTTKAEGERRSTTFAGVNPSSGPLPIPGADRRAAPGRPGARPDAFPNRSLAEIEKSAAAAPTGRAMFMRRQVAPQPRLAIVETAYWNPSVTTDREGKARVTFKAPTALSEYRITARGITGADTLAGQTTSAVTVRKDFFVELKVPSSLTQGDRPRFVARVHHTGVRGSASLRLAAYAGGRDDVFPRTLEIKGDGVDEVEFAAYEVPEGDSLRLTLSATMGEAHDEVVVEVPIRPWGVQAIASASGTGRDSTTVFLSLPEGRTYTSPDMVIVVSPTIERMLVELAAGESALRGDPLASRALARCIPPPSNTTADRASGLLAAVSVLGDLRGQRSSAATEADRLLGPIRGLTAELIASQNEDGGWAWVAPEAVPLPSSGRPRNRPSDRFTSALVFWAMASAERLGLLSDPRVLEQGTAYLRQELGKLRQSDWESRAAILHALSTRNAATFEAVNSVNRARSELSDVGLAYVALTLANIERPTLAAEVIGILGRHAHTEPVAPGRPPRVYWNRAGRQPFTRSVTEITALATLAFARVRPDAPELPGAVDWLNGARVGGGWRLTKAAGPAIAALSLYHTRARGAEDRYRLTVTVNDAPVAVLDVQGSTAGKVLTVPRAAIQTGLPNRIRFAMEGRGEFGYSAVLSGFTRDLAREQSSIGRTAWINSREYFAALPELDGKTLPVGTKVTTNPVAYTDIATGVAVGGRVRVNLMAAREWRNDQPEWERDFLIVEEHLPAGTSLIDGSVNTVASSYEVADGKLTLYFPPGVYPGNIAYELFGNVPGQYRVLPASIRSAYDPARFHLGRPGEFRVLSPGEASPDVHKPSPDELFARGKAHFEANRFDQAGEALEALYRSYSLREDVAKEAARMLLLTNLRGGPARKVVQYFEVVREKSPDLVLTFDQLLAIGAAYRDIKEYERAMIVWRGLIEASYLEDARVGALLDQGGQGLESIAYLIDLWRSYPQTASIESDLLGMAQVLTERASKAFTDPQTRRMLAAAGITRSQLLLQSIRMIQTFLALSPRNPMADEASLALVGVFIDLEDFAPVVRLSERFARLFPKSNYLDSFQYSEALGHFHLAQYDRAIEVAEAIARAAYKDATGALQPSPNKWQALYILGQIFDARRQPAKALEYYRQVADRFSDAAGAIQAYTRKELKVPEVTVVRPAGGPEAALLGAQAVAAVTLSYRNIARANATVYPVDLMQLYLTRRNLNGIAGINLAGITPLVDQTIELGNGADFEEKTRRIELPLVKEGAYLVMIRGDDLHASGIVLVSPLEIEVTEEDTQARASADQVRVVAHDAHTRELLPKVDVKVIGSHDTQFMSGQTDLRGVFSAEGVHGTITVLARQGTSRYAFYRGTHFLGGRPFPGLVAPAPQGRGERRRAGEDQQPAQSLDANLKLQNSANTKKQVERLQQRIVPAPAVKGQPGAPVGDFR